MGGLFQKIADISEVMTHCHQVYANIIFYFGIYIITYIDLKHDNGGVHTNFLTFFSTDFSLGI